MSSYPVAKVKTFGLGAVSYYKPGGECKDKDYAVNRRSRKIQWDYEDGAKKGDVLAGVEPGQGRVSQKLAELGPVWDLTTGSSGVLVFIS